MATPPGHLLVHVGHVLLEYVSIPMLVFVAGALALTYPATCDNKSQRPTRACIPTPNIPCATSEPTVHWECRGLVGSSASIDGSWSEDAAGVVRPVSPSSFSRLESDFGVLVVAALLGIVGNVMWKRLRPST